MGWGSRSLWGLRDVAHSALDRQGLVHHWHSSSHLSFIHSTNVYGPLTKFQGAVLGISDISRMGNSYLGFHEMHSSVRKIVDQIITKDKASLFTIKGP